jgi:transposase
LSDTVLEQVSLPGFRGHRHSGQHRPREGCLRGQGLHAEVQDQIVALHRRDGRTFGEIATEFGLSVAKWVGRQRSRTSQRVGPLGRGRDRAADAARIAQLECELAQKTEEVEILGKALAFFARRSER